MQSKNSVLFVVPQTGFWQPYGVMMLLSILSKNGYRVGIVEMDYGKIYRRLKKNKWDILAFSVMTPYYPRALAINKKLKDIFGVYSIFGGAHSTFFPEIIEDESIDAVCRGEGDFALLEFLEKKSKSESVRDVMNFWVKENKAIFKNEVRPFIKDLDILPFADREIVSDFNCYPLSCQSVIASRGCLFNCSYCFNESYFRLYKDKGERMRLRSVEKVIEELKQIKNKFNPYSIVILDDIFPARENWGHEFCLRYKKEIDLPFMIMSRPGHLTEQMVRDMKEAGCIKISIGIESASESLREKVLNRHMSNALIEDCCKMISCYGIGIGAFVLCGIPGSTIDDDLETLKFLKRNGVQSYIVNACQPYPNTTLFNTAIKDGLLSKDYKVSEIDFMLPCLSSPFIFKSAKQRKMIFNLICLYTPLANFNFSVSTMKKILSLPIGAFAFFLYKLSSLYAITCGLVFLVLHGKKVQISKYLPYYLRFLFITK